MALLCRVCLLSLLSGTAGLPAVEVIPGQSVETNGNRGTTFVSVARLDSTRAVHCFVDYGSGIAVGTCNVVSLDDTTLTVSSTSRTFSFSATQNVQVEAFSSTTAVVCFSAPDVFCKTLTIDGDDITEGSSAAQLNAQALASGDVPSLSVTSLSESDAVACWSSTNTAYQAHAGVCNRLTLSGAEFSVGAEYHFDLSNSVTDISVEAFSESAAVLCYRSQGMGACASLTLGGQSAPDDFDMGDPQDFFESVDNSFDSVVTINFGDGNGAVCYAGGTDQDYLGCKGMSVAESTLTLGTEEKVVSDLPVKWVTATATTDGAALVCYATADEAVTCNVIGVLDGTTLDAGLPNEVYGDSADAARTSMSLALASMESDSAVLCLEENKAPGSCVALTMPALTTTATSSTTITATTRTATTATTVTSTTTPHTTTESSTTMSTTTVKPAWEATDWGECSGTCGQGEETRNVTCSAGDEGLCEDARLPESRQCERYTECPYEWTCPMGPDAETGEGCGAQRAVVLTALVAAAVLAAALVGLLARRSWRRSDATGGPDKEVPAAPAAGGLPDDGSAEAYAAFCASLEAMEEARANGDRREYPKRPEVPRGMDFTHPAGNLAGASLSSTALDLAEGRRARAFPWPFRPSSS